MSIDSVKLRPGDRLEEGDQIYVASAQVWHTVKKGDTVCGMVVGTNSNCRRPVSRPVTNPITNDAAGEWEEETEDGLTSEEELTKTDEYLQRTLKENMELHNRLQTMKEHVDSLKKQLAALEEKLKAQEKTSAVVIEAARQERTRLITERDGLRQEVHNLQHSLLQHSLAVARTENEKLRSDPANSSLLQCEKKIAELQQKLQVSEERRLRLLHTDSVSAEQSETEVEKLAREIYLCNTYSVTDVFEYAEEFIAERDRRRKESGK